jgi:oligopeptide transport system permease protein
MVRGNLVETMNEDYIRTARAKGLPERQVIFKHALKVAVLPVVSYLGPLAAGLLTGSVVVESIFGIPGAGQHFVNSILNKDGFLLMGAVAVYCVLLVVLNFFVDVIYCVLDRRIKLYE